MHAPTTAIFDAPDWLASGTTLPQVAGVTSWLIVLPQKDIARQAVSGPTRVSTDEKPAVRGSLLIRTLCTTPVAGKQGAVKSRLDGRHQRPFHVRTHLKQITPPLGETIP